MALAVDNQLVPFARRGLIPACSLRRPIDHAVSDCSVTSRIDHTYPLSPFDIFYDIDTASLATEMALAVLEDSDDELLQKSEAQLEAVDNRDRVPSQTATNQARKTQAPGNRSYTDDIDPFNPCLQVESRPSDAGAEPDNPVCTPQTPRGRRSRQRRSSIRVNSQSRDILRSDSWRRTRIVRDDAKVDDCQQTTFRRRWHWQPAPQPLLRRRSRRAKANDDDISLTSTDAEKTQRGPSAKASPPCEGRKSNARSVAPARFVSRYSDCQPSSSASWRNPIAAKATAKAMAANQVPPLGPRAGDGTPRWPSNMRSRVFSYAGGRLAPLPVGRHRAASVE